jgi:hypothetical protein
MPTQVEDDSRARLGVVMVMVMMMPIRNDHYPAAVAVIPVIPVMIPVIGHRDSRTD